MIKQENLDKVIELLKKIPKKWDGKEAIIDMRDNGGRHWRQMEWIGWYFEFLCQRYLKSIMEFHKVKYGNTSFDGFLEVPFDFKAKILLSMIQKRFKKL